MTTSHAPAIREEGWLTSAARAWDRFFFSPADPTTLCCMRFFTGLILLYVLISYSFDLMSFVSPDRAWLDEQAANYQRHEMPVMGPPLDWGPEPAQLATGQFSWSIFFHLHDKRLIWAVHFAFIGISVLFTLGLWTRVTNVLAWIAAMSYIQRSLNTVFGMDTMLIIGLTYMMFAPAGATLSLDRWFEVRRARRLNPNAVVPVQPSVMANLAIRLYQIHFCFIYGAAGLSKLQGPSWWNGTALWGCLANYTFTAMDFKPFMWCMRLLCQHRWLWEFVMTGQVIFTLVMEIGFPFLVWLRPTRWLMVTGAILLHLGIGLIMGLVGFSMMMMVLVGSFIPPEVLRQQLDRLFAIRLPAPAETAPRPLATAARTEALVASPH
jgi:hypothetical protein